MVQICLQNFQGDFALKVEKRIRTLCLYFRFFRFLYKHTATFASGGRTANRVTILNHVTTEINICNHNYHHHQIIEHDCLKLWLNFELPQTLIWTKFTMTALSGTLSQSYKRYNNGDGWICLVCAAKINTNLSKTIAWSFRF